MEPMTPPEVQEALQEATAKFLTKEALLAKREVCVKKVEVPKLETNIHVKVLTAREVGSYSVEFVGGDEAKNKKEAAAFKYKYVGRCLCFENGDLMFSAKEIEQLGDVSARDIEYLFDAVCTVNPLGSEKEVEKELKNSEKTED